MVTFFLICKMTHYAVLYIYERRWVHKPYGLGIACSYHTYSTGLVEGIDFCLSNK